MENQPAPKRRIEGQADGTPPTPAMRPPPIPALTGLRFVAACLVLVCHCSSSFISFSGVDPRWHYYLTRVSYFGMILFFVLSGFVVYYNYSGTMSSLSPRATARFFVIRFARLYPMYLVVISLDLFRYGYFENLQNPEMAGRLYNGLPSFLLLMQSWYYTTNGDNTLLFSFPSMMQVTWSISTEWFFYLTFPFVCVVLARLRHPRAVAAALAGTIVLAYASAVIAYLEWDAIGDFAAGLYGPIAIQKGANEFTFWLFYLAPYFRLTEFILGCLTAALFMSLRHRDVTRREAAIGKALAGFALVCMVTVFQCLFWSDTVLLPVAVSLRMYFGIAPFLAILIFCCARYQNRLSTELSRPWIVACGEASYSIYLLHIGIVQYVEFFNQLARVPPATPDVWGIAHAVVSIVLVCVVTIGASLVTYHTIEMPGRRVLRRLLRSRRASRESALLTARVL